MKTYSCRVEILANGQRNERTLAIKAVDERDAMETAQNEPGAEYVFDLHETIPGAFEATEHCARRTSRLAEGALITD